MGWVKTIPAFLRILISAETLQVETAENVTNSANPSLRQCGNLPLRQSADRPSTGDRPSLGRADVRVAALVWALGLIPVLVRWTARPSPGRCLRVPLPLEDVHQFGMFDDLGPNLAGLGVVADQLVLNDADLPGRVLVAVPAHERVVDPAAFRPDRQAWGWDGRNAPASPVAMRAGVSGGGGVVSGGGGSVAGGGGWVVGSADYKSCRFSDYRSVRLRNLPILQSGNSVVG